MFFAFLQTCILAYCVFEILSFLSFHKRQAYIPGQSAEQYRSYRLNHTPSWFYCHAHGWKKGGAQVITTYNDHIPNQMKVWCPDGCGWVQPRPADYGNIAFTLADRHCTQPLGNYYSAI